MSGARPQFPPPGAPLPEEEASGHARSGPDTPAWGAPVPPPPPPPRSPVPGMLGAAHKPGAVPLRPLTLGNMYDGAFRIIRFNPTATVGAAALVTAVAMILPILVSAVVALTVGTGMNADGTFDEDLNTSEALGLIGSIGSLFLGTYVAQLGIVFVTGMIAHVTLAAAVGRRLSLADAWAATRGKRWRLLGQTLLVGLVTTLVIALLVALVVVVAVTTGDVLVTVLLAIAVGLASIPLFGWLWIKLVYLATPALMLEPIGIFASFRRTWRLTAGQFWRVLGIALLTVLITGFASQILGFPFGLVGQFGGLLAPPEYYFLIYTVSVSLGSVLSNAFVAPFAAAVTSLQYLDQRMRKEAYDVELMAEAGLITR